jgi:hypothetical protein
VKIMKRRKTSGNRRLEPMYAPTYTESVNLLKMPVPASIQTTGVFTLTTATGSSSANIATLLGYTGTDFQTKFSAYKLVAVTFSLKAASTRGVLNFQTGSVHILTDTLKAARVKPGKYTPEGLWLQASSVGVNPSALDGFKWTPTDVNIDYIEIALRVAA